MKKKKSNQNKALIKKPGSSKERAEIITEWHRIINKRRLTAFSHLLIEEDDVNLADWFHVAEVLRQAKKRLKHDSKIASSFLEKAQKGKFDVFLCYNSQDKPAILRIDRKLRERGILPWLDENELRPGMPWQPALEKQINKIKAAAVFVGASNEGPWQKMEIPAFLRKFVKKKAPVIPVLLRSCKRKPNLPTFLEGFMWVDFRKKRPDPYKALIWGITGKHD